MEYYTLEIINSFHKSDSFNKNLLIRTHYTPTPNLSNQFRVATIK